MGCHVLRSGSSAREEKVCPLSQEQTCLLFFLRERTSLILYEKTSLVLQVKTSLLVQEKTCFLLQEKACVLLQKKTCILLQERTCARMQEKAHLLAREERPACKRGYLLLLVLLAGEHVSSLAWEDTCNLARVVVHRSDVHLAFRSGVTPFGFGR